MSFAVLGGLSGDPDERSKDVSQLKTKTHITQVGTVIVPVQDQDQALDFYTETLGFEKRIDTPYGNGERWLEVAPPGAATTIAIVPPREGQPAGIETHVAFVTEDIDAAHADLRARGVDADDVMRMGDPVPPMFFFRDPDGNTFFIVEQS
jgi:catechol 2,3-dioxygenase-like lactoylglutathione lyase family enzyme